MPSAAALVGSWPVRHETRHWTMPRPPATLTRAQKRLVVAGTCLLLSPVLLAVAVVVGLATFPLWLMAAPVLASPRLTRREHAPT